MRPVSIAEMGPLIAAMLTGLMPVIRKLAPLIEKLTPVIIDMLDQLGPVFIDAMRGLLPVFEQIGPLIEELAPSFVDLVKAVVPLIPQIILLAIYAAKQLIPALIDLLPAITPLIPDIIDLAKSAIDLVKNLLPLVPIIVPLISKIIEFADEIVEWVEAWTDFKNLAEKAGEVVGKIKDAFSFEKMWEGAGKFWEAFFTDLSDTLPEPLSTFSSDIATGFQEVWDAIPEGIGTIGQTLSDDFKEIGQQAIDGFKESWDNFWTENEVGKWIGEKFTDFIGWVKDALGISSPSTEFASIGDDVIAGFIQGLEDKVDDLKAWWDQLWPKMKGWVTTGLGTVAAEFGTLPGKIGAALGSLAGVLSGIFTTAMAGAGRAVGAGIANLLSTLGGLPAQIGRAVGDLSGTLVRAGRSLIEGLISGVNDKWRDVQTKLETLTSKLPDWKGPAQRDRSILLDAGRLVMQGFIDGIESQYPQVRRSLTGLTGSLTPGGIDANFGLRGTVPNPVNPAGSSRVLNIAPGAIAVTATGADPYQTANAVLDRLVARAR